MTKQEFAALAARGTVILDGATGSNLRAAGMPVGVSPELWVLEHRTVLLDLQRAYVEAGSMILCTPTFSANRLSLRNFGLEERCRGKGSGSGRPVHAGAPVGTGGGPALQRGI